MTKAPKKPAKRKAAATKAAKKPQPANWTVEYLSQTVVDEVNAWPAPLRANLQRIIDRITSQGLMSLTEEHAKHIRNKIWELRPDADGMWGRAFYVAVTGKKVMIVLCKIKKTKKTPNAWIDLAEERAATIDQGE